MWRSRFSETQVIKMLKEAETGRPVLDIRREADISATTFYKWKTHYSDMEACGEHIPPQLSAHHQVNTLATKLSQHGLSHCDAPRSANFAINSPEISIFDWH